MIPSLARRWFLLLIILGIVVAWFWPAALHWTRHVQPQIVMALALFLSAWTLQSRRLYRALVWPVPALWALAISYGLLPALAWWSGPLLPIADFRIGLMISASVPCTLASAVLWTRMAGGDEATALLSTMLSTAMSWLATTAWLSLTTGSQVAIDTAGMMRDLALILVLPVGIGQLARSAAPVARFADCFRRPIGVVSRLLILVIMFRAAHDVSTRLGEESVVLGIVPVLQTGAICLGVHLLALFGGVWSSRRLGFDRATQIGVGFSGSQKTLPVSLVLLDLYFPGYPLAVVPLLFYHAGQLIVDTFIAESWAGARSQESGVRGQKSGVRSQGSGVSGPLSEIPADSEGRAP